VPQRTNGRSVTTITATVVAGRTAALITVATDGQVRWEAVVLFGAPKIEPWRENEV
jgi:hypothetical protein